MAHKTTRRSISFELLANDSPGDGEYDGETRVYTDANSVIGDDRSDKPKRKRRKSKNRKFQSDSNIGALLDESLLGIEEINSGVTTPPNICNPLSESALNDLVHPRADIALSDLAMDSVPLLLDVRTALSRIEVDSAVKEAQSLDTNRTFSLKSLASDDRLPASRHIEKNLPQDLDAKSTLKSESLRNLASGLPKFDSFPFNASGSPNEKSKTAVSSPTSAQTSPVTAKGISRFAAPILDTNIEVSAREGRSPESYSPSPRDRLTRRTSHTVNGISAVLSCNSVNGEAREPVFAPTSPRPFAELRQRSNEKFSDSALQENGADVSGRGLAKIANFKSQQLGVTDPSYLGRVDVIEPPSGYRTPPSARPPLASHTTPQLTEWDRLMAANSDYPATVDLSPIHYLLGEIQRGSSFERHSSAGIEQKRERIYNTMFHVPWRCELLIDVGFFVCLDSFLSLFTVMPGRILLFLWQRLLHWREFQRPYAAELSDFGSLIILVMGVAVLQQAGASGLLFSTCRVLGHDPDAEVLSADISFIYHYIRGQATIKLYVVFNVLEIFDKLCQSFGGDVLQVLLNSAVAIGECPQDRLIKQWLQFCLDQSIAIVSFLLHSLVIMSQAITVSAAINSQNNALLTLLISNNFAEIKSNVFKRLGKENLHKMAYHDTVERFHIMAHLLFVLAQNIQNSEDSWLLNFAYNAGMVLLCEVLVDVIKHAFLAKFNEIKPGAYSEFLQALCKQTLNSQSHEVHKTLHFVPLAPACVVLRVLIPLYAKFLPQGPFWQRLTATMMLGGGTYTILLALKIFVGLGLQMHAAWYLRRCKYKEGHPHAD